MAKERVKRKLSAILCADVVGYSLLMGEDEAATLRTLNTCDIEIIEPTVKEHNGRVFKRLGDGFLVEFSSAVDSVECALDWQKQIQNKKYPLQFRIGINLGDVIEQNDDMYGDGVNVAARIEKLADPGGICISRSIFEQIIKKVNMGFEYLGEQEVKNISDPIKIYKLLTNPKDAGKVIGADKRVVSKKFSSRQRLFATLAGILAFIMIAFFAGKFTYKPQVDSVASEENMAYTLPEEPSIAVMPFKAIGGGNEEEDLLSDGILTSITTALSKTPKLFTVDYASTSKYKGQDISIKDVAEELSIRYLLLGDLQKSGEQIRINVKLIDALTGENLWAEKYDRSMDNLFAMQDDITMQIMKALQVELYEGEYGNVLARGTDNLEAYLKIVKGYQHWQGGNPEDDAIAQRLAREAIELDPEYSPAYSLLSRTLWRQVIFRTTDDPAKTNQESLDAALKALELDYSADTLSQLGWVYRRIGQLDKAIETAERGLALNPNNSRALSNTGMVLMAAGRCEEAIGLLDKSLRISPIPSVNILFVASNTRFQCKQYDECIALAEKATELGPNSFLAHLGLARCYAMVGRLEEAKESATEVLRIFPKYTVKDYSNRVADNEKAQEIAARSLKAELMAGLPPDKSLKIGGE